MWISWPRGDEECSRPAMERIAENHHGRDISLVAHQVDQKDCRRSGEKVARKPPKRLEF